MRCIRRKLFDNFDDVVNRAVAEEEKRKAAAEKRRLDKVAVLETEKEDLQIELSNLRGLLSGISCKGIERRLTEIETELKKLTK